MKRITAIIPTLNEEIHIEDAIESVSFADEIIVIDSFSTDRTVEFAKKHNVVLLQREFDDFSTQKNFAIEKATYDWIYILDADERITLELRKEILKTVENPKDYVGFNIYRNFYFIGKRIRFSGFQKDKVVRLFLKNKCKYNGSVVHEKITTKGKVGYLKNKINHFSYRSLEHFLNKSFLYKRIQAEQMHLKGEKSNIFKILIKPSARFIKHYIIKLGFLDGFAGFVLSIILAFGVFLRYLKLWLLNNNIK